MNNTLPLKILNLFGLLVTVISVVCQPVTRETFKLDWAKREINESPNSDAKIISWYFEDGLISPHHPEYTLFSTRIPLDQYSELDIKINPKSVSKISLSHRFSIATLKENYETSYTVFQVRKKMFADISVKPVRKIGIGDFEKLDEFEIVVTVNQKPVVTENQLQFRNLKESVLASGDIYKIAIRQTGIHKIDKAFLEGLGIDISKTDPRKIAIYSNDGGPLPEANSTSRTDDLRELSIYVEGENDGRFDNNDYILFYAEGPDVWRYEGSQNNPYSFRKNIYDDYNYAFIKLNVEGANRIKQSENLSEVEYITEYFDDLMRYEVDQTNLLGRSPSNYGSGKLWFGDFFNATSEKDFSDKFDFGGYNLQEPISVLFGGAIRSNVKTSFVLTIDKTVKTYQALETNLNNFETVEYARYIRREFQTQLASQKPTVKLAYSGGGTTGEAWLDFIQISGRKRLNYDGKQMLIRDNRSISFSSLGFRFITVPQNIIAWDVTDPADIKSIPFKGNTFMMPTENRLKVLALTRLVDVFVPKAIGKIPNQNLHGINRADMLVVYHRDIKEAVDRFKLHREKHSNIKIVTVPVDEIYNEFSSGRVDPTAIRDLARRLYVVDPEFRYLLLFGDASYDYKGLMPGVPNQNFVPTYQTNQSLLPVSAFPADDYYGLLDDFEGDNLVGGLDISIGRFPVTTLSEAEAIVDKIIHYDTNEACLGDWRLNIGFAADDEDGNIHLIQSDKLASKILVDHPVYNLQKVYFDAFPQITTPGGQRYPEVNTAITTNINRGQLIKNYLGHGGPRGWAQERVLQIPDIQSWSNFDRLVLLITATCSLSGFDDPAIVTAGEQAFLNSRGGAIALFTTTRAVYASDNERLVNAAFDNIFARENNYPISLGDMITRAKNQNSQDTLRENARKFVLIGDPSQRLAIPLQEISITKINGVDVDNFNDTIKALEQVTIEGFVRNLMGEKDNGFNGIANVTVFDKPSVIQTLGNDQGSRPTRSFSLYRNIIFRGAASVTNGNFSFSFIVPKDINYEFGSGKISLYAAEKTGKDAAGFNKDIVIGGSSGNNIVDDTPPVVNLFINDESFVFGGITNSNPLLLINLKDDFGINITGTSIGHDLTAQLEGENISQRIVLNDFYQANVDDFRSGKVVFPLQNLEPGKYSVRVKAWDIGNNSSEALLEFNVVDEKNSKLKNVLNYPNPFTTNTQFNFEHDLPGGDLEVIIKIYSLSGKLVKTIRNVQLATGFRVANIAWDGRDDFGSKLAKGIYMYNITAKSSTLNQVRTSDFMKLAIL